MNAVCRLITDSFSDLSWLRSSRSLAHEHDLLRDLRELRFLRLTIDGDLNLEYEVPSVDELSSSEEE